ncbi:MAG TPA: hypothetical protein VGB64_09550 [Actinomycetota bacterium]
MGLFKMVRDMKKMAKQAKTMQGQQLRDAGYEPGVGGSMQQLGDLLGQANIQLEGIMGSEADRARLMSEGVDGEASIVAMGTPARGATMFNLMIDLEVRVPGRDAYRVANQYLVPASATLGIGVTLPVKVDPNDPAKITIDWDRAPRAPRPGEIRPVDPLA